MRGYENVATECIDDLVILKIFRDKGDKNYLSMYFLKEIVDALLYAKEEHNPKVMIITGGGKVFSLGADLAEVKSLTKEEAVAFSHEGQSLIKTVQNMDAVTVAAVHGMALGGGFELALACDIRWAHSRAVFGFPECLRGLISAWGGTHLAKYHFTPSMAADLLMTGSYLGAEHALKAGVISRIFTGRTFLEDVLTAAQQLSRVNREILITLKNLMKGTPSCEESLVNERTCFSEILSKNIASL